MLSHFVWWHVKTQSFIHPRFASDWVFGSVEENKCTLLCALNRAFHENSFLTRGATPPHRAIRSWTQLLIAGRLNLVCHQIPVGGRDGDVVQRTTRPLHGSIWLLLTLLLGKNHQRCTLNLEAPPLSALLLLMLPDCLGKNWFCGNLTASFDSNQQPQLMREKPGCYGLRWVSSSILIAWHLHSQYIYIADNSSK